MSEFQCDYEHHPKELCDLEGSSNGTSIHSAPPDLGIQHLLAEDLQCAKHQRHCQRMLKYIIFI